MRYRRTDELHSYHLRFEQELRICAAFALKHAEEKLPFGEMEWADFNRKRNAYEWLYDLTMRPRRFVTKARKPSREELLEAMAYMKDEAEDLKHHAGLYPKGDMKDSLRKIAKKELECAEFYTKLIEEGHFDELEAMEYEWEHNSNVH